MGDIRSIRLRQLHGRLGEVAYELTKVHFLHFPVRESWRPPVNAYRCGKCVRICVELAGVEESAIDLQAESRRLLIRGRRQLPEPVGGGGESLQILTMEIDHGL